MHNFRRLTFAAAVTFAACAAAEELPRPLVRIETVTADAPSTTRMPRANSAEPGAEFATVAATWSAADCEVATLSVSVSSDGAEWSEWVDMPLDADIGDDPGDRCHTQRVRVPVSREIRYRFSPAAPAREVTFRMFEPERVHDAPKTADSFSLGSLSIRSRTDWGCPDGQSSRAEYEPAGVVTHAIVHHTLSFGVSDWDAEVRSIWADHTYRDRDWGDIGYHYLIDPNGVIYEGRAGGIGVKGFHFSALNSNTVGIAMLGYYEFFLPSSAAMQSLKALLGELAKVHDLDPRGRAYHPVSELTLDVISGHRDANASPNADDTTWCPGGRLYRELPDIRIGVSAPPPPDVTAVTVSTTAGCKGYSTRQWVTLDGTRFIYSSKVRLDDTGDASSPFEIPADRTELLSDTRIRVCAGVSYARNWTAQVVNPTYRSTVFPFTVESGTTSVSIDANPLTIASGQSATLTWSSTGMTSCSASGGWSGTKATSGSTSVSPQSTTTYTISCSGAGPSKSDSVTVTVSGGGGAEPPPVVGLAVTPSTVSSGSPVYLGWATSNATQCTASDGWSGTRALTGSETRYPTVTTTYKLTCTGPGGSDSESVTVTVGSTQPGVDLQAAPQEIAAGDASTLTWSGTGVSSCTTSGGWSGSRPTGGTETVYPSSTTTYYLECTGNSEQRELIRNGTFYPPVTEWMRNWNFYADDRFTNCKSGGCPGYAYLSEYYGTLDGSNSLYGDISQEIDLPSDASSITLRYWMSISTRETSSAGNDLYYVVLKDTSGNYLSVLHGYSNVNAGGWAEKSADLTAWKGRRVRLEFWGSTNATLGSVFRIDDVSVIATVAPRYNDLVTVHVRQPDPPFVSIEVDPASIARGESATLSWSATNATTCTAGGGWSGDRPLDGALTVSPANPTSYELTCTGRGGTRNAIATLDVIPPAPTVTLSTSRSSIPVGESATLTWSSTDAATCIAYGAWDNEGTKNTSGTQSVSPLRTSTYTLECQGRGGIDSASTTVTVVQPALTAPAGFSATALSDTAVRLTWTPSAWTDHYRIERATAAAGPYALLATTTAVETFDVTVSANTAYVYRVQAVGYEGALSPYSNTDYAVTALLTDVPLVAANTRVKSVHVSELQHAANALRMCAGLATTAFNSVVPGSRIRASDLEAVRQSIDGARSALGRTDATVLSGFGAGTKVRAAHIEALRAAIR